MQTAVISPLIISYMWEGLMGFSENPFLSARKFSKFKNFVWKKSGFRSDSRNLSRILIRPLKVENFPTSLFYKSPLG
jgi:hypothetical protein